MATLAQTIKQGGKLQKITAEELAQQQGRDLSAVTPQETKVLGGTEQQAAMAGTPAQTGRALRQAVQEGENLATRLRRQQVRRTATEAEAEKLARGERTQKLGALDERVQALAEQALETGAAQEQQVQLQAAADDQQSQQLLDRIRQNPADTAAITELYRLQGMDQAAQIIAADGTISADAKNSIIGQFGGEPGEIGRALASSVQDQIESGELDFAGMGFEGGLEEVAQLIGTTPENLTNMSIAQLTEQVNSAIQTDFGQVADLQRRVADPAIGAAERAEARAQLREMGAVGVRSIESEMDDLADEIQAAETVEFMGQEMAPEELLDNEYLSGLVKNYFDTPGFKEDLEKSEPKLAEFIERHQTLLSESKDQIEQGLGDFAKIQYDNINMSKIPGVGEVDPGMMEKMVPGFGDIRADRLSPPPVIEMLKDQGATADMKLRRLQGLEHLNQRDPAFAEELGQMTRDQLSAIGMDEPQGDRFNGVLTYLDRAKAVSEVHDPDQAARFIGAESMDQVQESLEEARLKEESGFFPAQSAGAKQFGELFSDPTRAAQNLQDRYLPGGRRLGLRELTAGVPEDIGGNFAGVQQYAGQQNRNYDLVKDVIRDNGRISSRELRDRVSAQATDEELEKLFTDPVALAKFEDLDDAKATASEVINRRKQDEIEQDLVNTGKFSNFEDFVHTALGKNKAGRAAVTNPQLYERWLGGMEEFITVLEEKTNLAKQQGNPLTEAAYKRDLDWATQKMNQYKERRRQAIAPPLVETRAPHITRRVGTAAIPDFEEAGREVVPGLGKDVEQVDFVQQERDILGRETGGPGTAVRRRNAGERFVDLARDVASKTPGGKLAERIQKMPASRALKRTLDKI